jgi:aspartyl-tRNA(Asn)/glutamyl-tRNA(Gln) amidotransferase subunit C
MLQEKLPTGSKNMIDKKAIEHIAKLARLHVTESEAQEFSTQLSKALGYFEQISKVPTEGVEPLVTPSEIETFWREDKVTKEFSADQLVANAPDKVGNLFKVPPVV